MDPEHFDDRDVYSFSVGFGLTVTVTVAVLVQPAALVPVTV